MNTSAIIVAIFTILFLGVVTSAPGISRDLVADSDGIFLQALDMAMMSLSETDEDESRVGGRFRRNHPLSAGRIHWGNRNRMRPHYSNRDFHRSRTGTQNRKYNVISEK